MNIYESIEKSPFNLRDNLKKMHQTSSYDLYIDEGLKEVILYVSEYEPGVLIITKRGLEEILEKLEGWENEP